MKKLIFYIGVLFLLIQCQGSIKNKDARVEQESGTTAVDMAVVKPELPKDSSNLYGFWVGYFNEDLGDNVDSDEYFDDSYYDGKANKINISIDRIFGDSAWGHSVVAGNDRPFAGIVKKRDSFSYFEVREPGDNKYDGAFNFQMNDTALTGTWAAYGKVETPKRKYILSRKVFHYNPDQMLDNIRSFVNNKKSKQKYDKEWGEELTMFASATDKIYKLNASNKILTKKNVENLKKGDLLVIRNAIYARHGYSFKNMALRVFFDAQDWYIPLYANIKTDLTEIEKQNIQLFLLYEKNAKEYYDYFGR